MPLTCTTCGHSGERISDARGFCAQCGNLPSRRAEPVGKLMVNCLRCGTAREHDADCAVCAGRVQPGAPTPAAGVRPGHRIPLAWSFAIATIATMLHWSVAFVIGAVGTFAAELPAYVSTRSHVETPFVFNAFTSGLVAGAVTAAAVAFFVAYKGHPILGAFASGSAGTIVTLAWWLLA